jgi:hypothetical protein
MPIHGWFKVIGLGLAEVAIDGSLHKNSCGRERTVTNTTDRARLGCEWSIATDRHGVPTDMESWADGP